MLVNRVCKSTILTNYTLRKAKITEDDLAPFFSGEIWHGTQHSKAYNLLFDL